MQFNMPVILTLSLVFCCGPGIADNVDTLPPGWQGRLKPVAEVDLSPLKPDEQKAIRARRAEVDTLLLQGSPDWNELASAYGRLGNLYLAHELRTSASACYRNAVKLQPGHFPWAYYTAYLAHREGDLEEALSAYKKAIELDPDYLPAHYRLAQVYLDLNRLDDAQTLFEKLLSAPEYEAAASNGLGQVSLRKQDHHKAVEYFSRALELEPRATKIHYPLAMSLRAAGQSEQAKQHLSQFGKQELVISDRLVDSLQALKNPASLHFSLAMTAVVRKDFPTAIREFNEGLEHEPDNSAARTSYARVLYLNGTKDEARTQLEQVVASDPDKPLALFLLALLDDEAKNMEEAAKLYSRVIALDPEHEGARFFLGNYYLHQNDYEKAINQYDAVLQSNEKNVPAMVFKLVAMMNKGAPDQALLELINNITNRAPGMAAMKRIKALLLALSNDEQIRDTDKAVSMAETMYRQDKHPANLELLALTLAAAGDYEKAASMMRHALSTEKELHSGRNIKRIKKYLSVLESGKLPELEWREETRHLLPPPTSALATFRDYPDSNPI